MSSIVDLIKLWLITSALSKPITWVAIVALFSVLLLVAAVFFKFKNSWVSIISFFLLQVIGIVFACFICGNYLDFDEMHLKSGTERIITDVTPDGVLFERRVLRNRATPLLGITLPEDGSEYYNQAKELILSSRFKGSLRVYESSGFRGVVLADVKGKSLNEELLKRGLAYASSVSPKAYLKLQNKAISSGVGMWSKPRAVKSLDSIMLVDYTAIWLVVIYVIAFIIVVITPCKNIDFPQIYQPPK